MSKFNVQILKLARESRCLTQVDLANLLNIEQGTVSKIEKEILQADDETVSRIAEVLRYPIAFFYQNKTVLPIEGHYRRKTSVSVKVKKQNEAQMTISGWHFLKLMDEVDLPENNLPFWDVLNDGTPSECAKFLRQKWSLPNGRVTNLSKIVEDNGVVIIPLDLEEMDGLSTFIDSVIPVIFINKSLPPDRYRLTLAHELGHLILHLKNIVSVERDVEKEAYEFAIELLVPENTIRPYFNKVTIEKLADLKSYWYVSMQALLKYARTLGMITDHQSKYLWIQMGTLGYRKKEPISIPVEKPLIIKEILDAYFNGLGYTEEEICQILFLTPSEFNKTYINQNSKFKIVR